MPIDHNGPGATQCHVGGFGLCDAAQHNQDTLLGRLSGTSRRGQHSQAGALRQDQALPDLGEPQW